MDYISQLFLVLWVPILTVVNIALALTLGSRLRRKAVFAFHAVLALAPWILWALGYFEWFRSLVVFIPFHTIAIFITYGVVRVRHNATEASRGT